MSGSARTFSSASHGTASPPNARGKSGGTIVGTVHHLQFPDAAAAQLLHHLLRHRARADDQRHVPFQIAEDALGQFHARQRHRHRPRAHFRFRAHALSHFERALKRAIQHRSGGAVFERLPVGRAQLAQNFRLAQHHRIEARGNAIEVPHRLGPVQR